MPSPDWESPSAPEEPRCCYFDLISKAICCLLSPCVVLLCCCYINCENCLEAYTASRELPADECQGAGDCDHLNPN